MTEILDTAIKEVRNTTCDTPTGCLETAAGLFAMTITTPPAALHVKSAVSIQSDYCPFVEALSACLQLLSTFEARFFHH